jgi:hypothetical protein
VGDFFAQNSAVFVVELGDLVNSRWALCYQGAFDENWHHLTQVELGSKLLDILD